MLNRAKVTWCEEDDPVRAEQRKNMFGPPLYDVRQSSYQWRQFKKGFIWGR